jgi:hypothetical protein
VLLYSAAVLLSVGCGRTRTRDAGLVTLLDTGAVLVGTISGK